MPRAYTTAERVQDYLKITTADIATSTIELWIEDMSEYIEDETGRVFEADGVASEKIYEVKPDKTISIGLYQNNPRMLLVDEFVTGSNKLTIDDDLIDSDDYIFYPINENPKTKVVLTEDSGLVFTEDEQNIKFEACWGYSETPPRDIIFACTVLVAGIINNFLTKGREIQSMSLGRYSVTFKTEKELEDIEKIQGILEKYTKLTL